MVVPLRARDQQSARSDLIKHAVGLLSQQVWCWGRDILRADGNWLIEIGFNRIAPPADHEGCSSIYSLELSHGRCIVLRGFGVFYGDLHHGGIFLPRYEFRPKYTTQATLECLPWSEADLPKLHTPSESQQTSCLTLTSDLIEWIQAYELNIVKVLVIEYRRSILREWNNGKRPIIPAEEMAHAWQQISVAIYEDFRVLIPPCRIARSQSHA